ncbi:MAG TPA: PspC domain-containing protein [Steroidobacteraceae bacterium]|nr:PspC domain-containing protein [Steroidobacteraceae bacterium]
MRPVMTISLNGNAYQIEQGGYESLRAYLATAAGRLATNPDRAEILADLEQAIAEKCSRFLSAHQSVVTEEEIEQVLREMGPVDGGEEAQGSAAPGETSGARARDSSRRLYQIREGAMVSGVCNGIAAYFDVDVTIVRVAFVALAILSWGAWILAYIVMMFVIPYAETSEQRAAAHGWQFTAQELIDRAKRHYAEFKDGQQWRRRSRAERRSWRSQQRAWRAQARSSRRAQRAVGGIPPWESRMGGAGHAVHVLGGLMSPLIAILGALIFAAFVLAAISLLASHAILGWVYPRHLPIWVGIVGLVLIYSVIASPLRPAHHFGHYGPSAASWVGLWGAVVWVGLLIWVAWFAAHHWPEVQHWLDQLAMALQHLGAQHGGSAPAGASI